MRELRLWRPLNPANELERVMLQNPGLRWTSVTSNVSRGTQTILMHFFGSRRELDNVKHDYVDRPPKQLKKIEVLKEGRGEMYVYEAERTGQGATDLSGIVYRSLGPETLVEIEKGIDGVRWRILTFREERVPDFIAQIDEQRRRLERSASTEVQWYRLVGQSGRASVKGRGPLTPLESRILSVAIDSGYYERPKRCDLRAVAKKLQLPVSTTHYRLKAAEKKAILLAIDRLEPTAVNS